MEKVERVVGRMVPVPAADVDTDQIIPAVWMKKIERTGFEDGLFEKWRRDPEFVLNRPERAGATVLVSGPNFGCGSSREHAPWALRDYGFKAVVAPSFADIFRGNLPNVGLVPVTLGATACEALLEASLADASVSVEIDVVARRVRCEPAGVDESFDLDEMAHVGLTNGKDLIDLALLHDEAIEQFESRRSWWLPATNGQVEDAFAPSGMD